MIGSSGPAPSADPTEVAARFAAEEQGWADRVFAQHTALPSGDCAGCGCYRRVRWPCVQIRIAERVREIVGKRAPHSVTEVAAPVPLVAVPARSKRHPASLPA